MDILLIICYMYIMYEHGSSIFVRDGLKVNIISVCEEDNVEFITVLPV